MAPAQRIPRFSGRPRLAAVLFDAGLTLIRAATPAAEVARVALERQGLRAAAADYAAVMDEAQVNLEAQWHTQNWWAAESTVRLLFTDAYQASLVRSPLATGDDVLAAQLAHAIYDEYQETHHWAAYADVLPTLQALRQAGVAMGIVSDWGHGLEAIVLELELGDYFSGLVVSSRLGMAKPHAQVFEVALERLGVPAAETVYIGDTYVKDVLGARAAGITPVLLDRAGRAPAVDCLRVGSLLELLDRVGVARC